MKGVKGRPPVGVQKSRSERRLDTGKSGRPKAVKYDRAIATKIAALIADGQSVTNISHMPKMPVRSTLMRWYRDEPDFKRLVDIAVVDRADYYLDKIVDIFDRVERDNISIEKAKFLVDQWKWVLLKMHPKFEEGRKQTEQQATVQFQITLSDKPKKLTDVLVHDMKEITDAKISVEKEREIGEGNETEDGESQDALLCNEKEVNGLYKEEEGSGPTSDGGYDGPSKKER